MHWKTARRDIDLNRPLVMGILNVTPDSFSDGGKFGNIDAALDHAGRMIADGADMIDIGGESTRPGSDRVPTDIELDRVVPVIERLAKISNIPIAVDTTRSIVAAAAVSAGAEVINDISGLRWDEDIADVASSSGAGLILMHSRGSFETMHSQAPVPDILTEVISGLRDAIKKAEQHGVSRERVAVDIGFGFGKTFEQNVELLAKLDRIAAEFETFPLVVGTSRKSFIGKILCGKPVEQRLSGSIATALFAIKKGSAIVRSHDVAETVDALRVSRTLTDAQ